MVIEESNSWLLILSDVLTSVPMTTFAYISKLPLMVTLHLKCGQSALHCYYANAHQICILLVKILKFVAEPLEKLDF